MILCQQKQAQSEAKVKWSAVQPTNFGKTDHRDLPVQTGNKLFWLHKNCSNRFF